MLQSLKAKRVTVEQLVELRGKIEITSEQDMGIATLTMGCHALAGLVVLISTAESQGCAVIAQNRTAVFS